MDQSSLTPLIYAHNISAKSGVFALALCFVLSACINVGPDFVSPDMDAPLGWSEPLSTGLVADPPKLGNWWLMFNDPVLNNLVALAHRNNNTLEIAGVRILETRAQLGIATGLQYPQSQIAAGDATYISPAGNTGATSGFWQYGLGASAAWEIDFWGRFRRGIESADAAYLASIAAYNEGLVILTAAVVDTYTIIRATEMQLRISRDNVEIQRHSFDITEVLYRNGSDSELDMQQAQTLLLSTEATIPSLEAALKQTRNALSTLLGQPPGSTTQLLADGEGIPSLPESTAIGFPADMLRNRPDVRQAELLAMSQNALVGLAKADLYPSFSIVGSIGVAAGGPGDSDFDDLFDSDALTYAIGPTFVWPFLNYGRIKNNVRVQDARLQQALINYRETVLQAAREAEDAMAAYIGNKLETDILTKTVVSAMRSNELSTLRYSEGFSDYQRVLDAQKSLFTQQQRYITTQGNTVRSLIAIYKALGGGWEHSILPYVDEDTLETMRERTNWGGMLDASYPDPN
jgi:NodT family efflux transporter outer membrane factor (OMF) lipoprotein